MWAADLSMNVCTVQRLTVLLGHGHESVKLGCLEGGGESGWIVEYLPPLSALSATLL